MKLGHSIFQENVQQVFNRQGPFIIRNRVLQLINLFRTFSSEGLR